MIFVYGIIAWVLCGLLNVFLIGTIDKVTQEFEDEDYHTGFTTVSFLAGPVLTWVFLLLLLCFLIYAKYNPFIILKWVLKKGRGQ